ncbi:ABC transporter A family member 2-like [Olea europaea subsp. europaea]|uniref:ABC transporter A family member 2-like n=1 Tax=Olea europaea subsp. europaea TaxID=158383 RepID=A0A8S0VK61_OLEEU|nr:ABC transporter A family member 2-like [Olea europaea subsp. europaea]
MELQRGFPLLIQQYKALLFKNLLLSWRNKRSTFLQLFSSVFFIFIIFCIQKAVESSYASSSSSKSINDPEPLIFPPIPPCEEKFYSKLPCFDFVWSGNDSARIGEIVRRIRENNPGRSIPSDKVQSFKTRNEVDDWLANNPMRCPGALHFVDRNATVISYGLQTNSTPLAKRGSFEDPTFKFQIPLQLAAEREIARSLIGDASFSWVVSLKEFAHPAIEIFSAVQRIGSTFFLAIAMFAFIFQISALTMERELKLRQAMTIMGLYDTAYWLSWLTWEAIVTLLSSLFTVLFGMMFQFVFFLQNSFAVVFLLFFLFQLSMTAFAFMLSAFISKSDSSSTLGFFSFIIGSLTQVVTAFGFPYSDNFSNMYRIVWSFFPPNLFAKGLELLSDATATPQDPGVSWNGRTKCSPNDTDCIITINGIYIRLLFVSFFWFVLAIYFDNIFPNTSGVRKSIFYFLSPGYWTGNGGKRLEALIYGYSVRSSTGMSNIRRMIGVCPQFDILWDALSGQEHLYLFASIKGLSPASIESVVQKLLAEVKLTESAKMRAGSYSGGMRRRLSVAIALIGEPKLVILDEPTTGMDPIARRHVWDVIEEVKKGRAIILTTHSMEEADILSDRIGIMAKGRLRCIGTSIRLKSRFGTGFIATINFSRDVDGNPNRGDTFNTTQQKPVKELFKSYLNVMPKEENKYYLTFVIPYEKEKLLTNFFEELQEKTIEYGIADIQLGLTTLEEVFLNMVKQAELENAVAEGYFATMTLNSVVSVQVPVGARFVGVPGSESIENPRGIMVEVYWEQDDAGALCVSGHSDEMPIPPHVQLRATSASTSGINILDRQQQIHGIVIDPAQITDPNL